MKQQQARKIGISFYPETEAIVEQENRRLGLYNFSAALRYIINDWARIKGRTTPVASECVEATP